MYVFCNLKNLHNLISSTLREWYIKNSIMYLTYLFESNRINDKSII